MEQQRSVCHGVNEGVGLARQFSPVSVLASIQVPAEVSRVLYALAIPEYIEAWLFLPGADRVECHSEFRSYDRFRIEAYSGRKIQRTILASCLLLKPGRVTYLWERDSISGHPRSTVEMQLWGRSRASMLTLKHCGLQSQAERHRNAEMWNRSLRNLRLLMERAGGTEG